MLVYNSAWIYLSLNVISIYRADRWWLSMGMRVCVWERETDLNVNESVILEPAFHGGINRAPVPPKKMLPWKAELSSRNPFVWPSYFEHSFTDSMVTHDLHAPVHKRVTTWHHHTLMFQATYTELVGLLPSRKWTTIALYVGISFILQPHYRPGKRLIF